MEGAELAQSRDSTKMYQALAQIHMDCTLEVQMILYK